MKYRKPSTNDPEIIEYLVKYHGEKTNKEIAQDLNIKDPERIRHIVWLLRLQGHKIAQKKSKYS